MDRRISKNPRLTRNYTNNRAKLIRKLTAIASSTAKEICGTRRKIEESNSEATIRHWREAGKSARRQFQSDKKCWQEDWWLRVVEEAKDAEGSCDTRKLYQT